MFSRETGPTEQIMYLELGQVIIEADKSQHLQLAGKLETKESQWCSSSPSLKARDTGRADVSVQIRRKGKTDIPALRQPGRRSSIFLHPFSAIQALKGLDEAHPH